MYFQNLLQRKTTLTFDILARTLINDKYNITF